MAGNNDLVLQLIIKAVDLATKDIDGVHDKLESLRQVLAGNELDRSAEGMRAFGDAVKDSTDPLALAAKNTLALSAAMTGVASYMANQAYQASKDYESALADLAKVLDGDKEKAKQYGDQINQLALSYSQNGQALVASMANFVQAGYDAKEAFDLVEQSVKLMIAGELEAGESSDYLVSILKGFKAPAAEAAGVVDLLNEVSNKYATDVKHLAIGMAGISPIAKQMGFSMGETAGLLTPVIEVYRSGSEAADALKTGLQALADDTAPVKAALDSIGVSQLDLNGKLRSGKDIFLDVAKAMVGLDDATKQFVIQQLVGVEQAGRMTQVFDNLSGYLGVTEAAMNSAGSAMKEIESRLDTAEAKSKRAEESFRQLAVTLGNTFKPQIAGVVGATGDLAAAFDKAVKAGDLAPLLNVIKPQIAAVENLFQAMAANLDDALAGVDWRPLTDAIKEFSGEFGEAMAALTDGMDLSTVEGLRNLLQALINLMGNFTQYVAGVVDGLEPFLDSLNVLFKAVSDNSPALANLAGQITGLATSANLVLPAVSSLGSLIFGAVGSVVELTLKIGLLVGGLKLLSAAGIPVGSMLGGLLSRFLALNPAVAGLLSAMAGLPGLVVGLAGAAGGLGYAIGTVVNKTVEWASGGQSVGSMLYDLIHGSDEAAQAITRVATAEELAAAAAQRTARELAAKAEAERKAAEASAQNAKVQQGKIDRNAQETETIERLKAQYAQMGLVWDELTGEITHQNELTAAQKRANLELAQALAKVGVEAGVMSGRITAGGEEMLKTLNGIAANAQATAKEINAAILAMVPELETEAELEALRKKIEQLGKDGKLTGDQVSAAFETIADRSRNLVNDPAFDALRQRLADAREETDRGTEAMDRWQEKARLQTQAAIQLARARGDEAEAAREVAKAAQEEIKFSQERLEQLQAQQAEISDNIQLLVQQARADGQVTDAERKVIEALQDKSAAIGVNIAQIEKQLPLQEREAAQAERMAGPIGQLIRLYDQKATAAGRETDAVERAHDANIRTLEVEQKQAIAKGDTARAAELGIQIARAEVEQTEAVAAAKQAEMQAEIDLLEAKKLDVLASEKSAQAKAEELAAIDAKIAKLKDLQNAERDRVEAANAELEAAKRSAEALKAQAQAAADAERETRRMAAVVGYAAQNFGQLNEKGRAAMAAIKSDPLVKAAQNSEELARATAQLVKQLDDAAGSELAFAESLAALEERANGVGPAAERAKRELVAMAQSGQYGISGITSAGQSAIEKLNGIRNAAMEAEQALNQMAADFERQILQLKGEQDKILDLEHEQNLRNLKEQYETAGRLGGDEYLKAKARAEELHRLKLKQLADEENAKARQQREGTTTVRPSGGGGGSGGAGTSGPVNVTVNVPNAMLVDDRTADAVARRLKPVFDGINRRLA